MQTGCFKGCFVPGVQVFPSVCRLIPVGQAQLEALGAGARRQRWLQPPLFTEQGFCTADRDTQNTLDSQLSKSSQRRGKENWNRNAHLPDKVSETLQETQKSSPHQWDQWGFTLVWAPEALFPLSQWSGFSLPIIPPVSAETQDLSSEKRRQNQ